MKKQRTGALPPVELVVRVTQREANAFIAAAKAEQVPLNTWARGTLKREAAKWKVAKDARKKMDAALTRIATKCSTLDGRAAHSRIQARTLAKLGDAAMSSELEAMNAAFEAWWTYNELPVPRESARWIFNAGYVHATENPDRIQVGGVSVKEVAKRLANFEKGMRRFVRCPHCHDDIPLDKEGKLFPHGTQEGNETCPGSGMESHYKPVAPPVDADDAAWRMQGTSVNKEDR